MKLKELLATPRPQVRHHFKMDGEVWCRDTFVFDPKMAEEMAEKEVEEYEINPHISQQQ